MNILKNKAYKDYNRLSRYASFPYYYNSVDNKYMTGTAGSLSKNTKYTNYEVTVGESYDLIALKAYNNPTYYWIICDFNDVEDAFNPPLPGTILKIPLISEIMFNA